MLPSAHRADQELTMVRKLAKCYESHLLAKRQYLKIRTCFDHFNHPPFTEPISKFLIYVYILIDASLAANIRLSSTTNTGLARFGDLSLPPRHDGCAKSHQAKEFGNIPCVAAGERHG